MMDRNGDDTGHTLAHNALWRELATCWPKLTRRQRRSVVIAVRRLLRRTERRAGDTIATNRTWTNAGPFNRTENRL
jgi:hypothetical protein